MPATVARALTGRRRESCHGRIEVTDGRLRGAARGRSCGPTGPVRQRRISVAELDRDLLADEHVQLVAGLDDRRAARRDRAVAAHDHVQQRLAREPELAHRVAHDRVAVAHRELHRLRAQPVQQHRLDQRCRDRRLVGGHAQPAARPARSSAPCSIVESSTTKNATWKIRSPVRDALGHREGGEHDRRRAAQARPAEHQPLGQREAVRRTISAASGRATTAVTMRDRGRPRGMISTARAGSRAARAAGRAPSCATQARPSWKVMIVRRAGEDALPITRPARKTARKPEPCSDWPRRRRRARANATEATGYRPADGSVRAAATIDAEASRPRARRRRRSQLAAPPARARRASPKSACWIASMQPSTSSTAIGSLMPDSPSSVRASRRRSVDPRSTAKTAAASVAATVEPRISASSVAQLGRTAAPAASAVSPAVTIVPTRRQQDRDADHRPDLGPAAGQAALVQDQRERDDRRDLRGVVVRELVPKSISASPSEPITMPSTSTSTRPGSRRRPASSEAPMPAASRAPTARATSPDVHLGTLSEQRV